MFRFRRVAKALPVLVAPVVSFGYYPAFVRYPGSQHLRADTFMALLTNILTGFVRQGARRLAVINTAHDVRVAVPTWPRSRAPSNCGSSRSSVATGTSSRRPSSSPSSRMPCGWSGRSPTTATRRRRRRPSSTSLSSSTPTRDPAPTGVGPALAAIPRSPPARPARGPPGDHPRACRRPDPSIQTSGRRGPAVDPDSLLAT